MDKCPYCGAETRPGDNFCLNCGNRLPALAQAAGGTSDATQAAEANWTPTVKAELDGHEAPTVRSDGSEIAVATLPAIEKPARLTLRTDSGETLQEFTLDKPEFAIGRAPNSDILLSKDKLTSRRHAIIRYENGTYFLQDEHSANGTFVNGQQLEEKSPYQLRDDDHVSIGEYELIFHATATNSSVDIPDMPTIVAPSGTQGFETQPDPQLTAPSSIEYDTHTWEEESSSAGLSAAPAAVAEKPLIPAKPADTPLPVAELARQQTISAPLESSGVTFGRLTSLPQPQLPDVAPLMAALATLDGQVSSLQEQLNATQEAMRNHETEIAQTANQLRTNVHKVSERMDSTIAEVARSREQLAWAELLQLMEDVMNNPRDIEYVTKLARKARELNKVFQIHQNVLNTLAECTSLLRSLSGDERS
ncbi:MAG: FHA domain-containing protein [Ktedonobacteraceae bacterium]